MDKKLVINWYRTLDSTNSEAQRHLDLAPEGSVWAADFQTSGRGQRGNTWESARGENLMFTVLFRPEFLPAARQFLISQAAALGVCRYLCEKGLNACIKWPNDIYVGDKKICGMLIEHTWGGDKLSASIAGIGINLNQVKFDSDAPNPTSLLLEAGGSPRDRKQELQLVLERIFAYYEILRTAFDGPHAAEGGDAVRELEAEYLGRLYRRGEWHRFKETPSGAEFTAKITGIDASACLVLEQENGTEKAYAFQEIRYIL